MNLALIGYRGTGKSTVARELARRLGWSCHDSDELVEARAGRTIAEIFAAGGEAAFRDLESAALAELAAGDQRVLSLGGGAVLREENRRLLAARCRVVWLTAPAEELARRMATDTTTADRRPNLTAAGGLAEITELLARRTPIYRQCADHAVDTQGKTPAEVADEILRLIDRP